MTPTAMQDWNGFFVAEAGAAAALAGLLFVAVSINLTRVLEQEQLPTRAIEALVTLASVLVAATFALVPRQPSTALGIEIAATGLIAWVVMTVGLARTHKLDRGKAWMKTPRARLARVSMNQLPPLPFIVSGGLLVAHGPGGVYWMVPGVLLSFVAGISGAWILLVEIQR